MRSSTLIRRSVLLPASAAFLAFAAAACSSTPSSASVKPTEPQAPRAAMAVEIEEGRAIGPGASTIPARALVRNLGEVLLELGPGRAALMVEGCGEVAAAVEPPPVLGPGEEALLLLSFALPEPAPGTPRMPRWTFAAELPGRGAGGIDVDLRASAEGSFLLVAEPELSIVSIKVKRAELINTRLVAALRVENPNAFPVTFLSLSYELYGAGRFWADGDVAQPVTVPAEGSAEIELKMVMNFINMKRDLLDQVIRSESVDYRWTGTASVVTPLDAAPRFDMDFDRTGRAEVVE